MKTKKRLILILFFPMSLLLLGNCTEEEEAAQNGTIDGNIYVLVAATQDGAEGGNSVKFKISLQNENQTSLTNTTGSTLSADVSFTGTAIPEDFETDFVNIVSIANGESEVTLEMVVRDDQEVEGEETLTLNLSAPSIGVIDGGTATARILDNDESSSSQADISVLAEKFYHTSAVTFTYDDNTVTITAKDLPDHTSMYYDPNSDLYEAYDEPNNPDFKKNPGSIGEQNLVFKLPRYPAEANNKSTTSLGPMGVTINSVAFFNQQAAPGDDIFEEENTFDQYEGHPAGTQYHYHLEPTWLTQHRTGADNEAFLGLLLDGFPVYGTHEDGVEMTNNDLDAYHGHFGATADFPDGIYHYHITVEYPWINGDGFYGTPGTVTQ